MARGKDSVSGSGISQQLQAQGTVISSSVHIAHARQPAANTDGTNVKTSFLKLNAHFRSNLLICYSRSQHTANAFLFICPGIRASAINTCIYYNSNWLWLMSPGKNAGKSNFKWMLQVWDSLMVFHTFSMKFTCCQRFSSLSGSLTELCSRQGWQCWLYSHTWVSVWKCFFLSHPPQGLFP